MCRLFLYTSYNMGVFRPLWFAHAQSFGGYHDQASMKGFQSILLKHLSKRDTSFPACFRVLRWRTFDRERCFIKLEWRFRQFVEHPACVLHRCLGFDSFHISFSNIRIFPFCTAHSDFPSIYETL